MPTKTFNLTEETIARLKAEPNQSQTIEKALEFYWSNKDLGRKLIANSDQILKLITQGTPHFQEPNEGPVEIGSLAWWRREYPYDIFKEEGDVVYIQHKGTKQWAVASEVY